MPYQKHIITLGLVMAGVVGAGYLMNATRENFDFMNKAHTGFDSYA